MNTRTVVIAVAVALVVAAVISAVYVYAYRDFENVVAQTFQNGAQPSPCNTTKPRWMLEWRVKGFGRGVPLRAFSVEVSDEFKAKILSILQSNDNTSSLLQQGYNVTRIIPVKFSFVIGGDGTVTIKVTQVVVELVKDSNRAAVWIDVATGNILKIVTVTVTAPSTTTTSTTSTSSTVAV